MKFVRAFVAPLHTGIRPETSYAPDVLGREIPGRLGTHPEDVLRAPLIGDRVELQLEQYDLPHQLVDRLVYVLVDVRQLLQPFTVFGDEILVSEPLKLILLDHSLKAVAVLYVQDAHLLDDGGFARLARAEQQHLDRVAVQLAHLDHLLGGLLLPRLQLVRRPTEAIDQQHDRCVVVMQNITQTCGPVCDSVTHNRMADGALATRC